MVRYWYGTLCADFYLFNMNLSIETREKIAFSDRTANCIFLIYITIFCMVSFIGLAYNKDTILF